MGNNLKELSSKNEKNPQDARIVSSRGKIEELQLKKYAKQQMIKEIYEGKGSKSMNLRLENDSPGVTVPRHEFIWKLLFFPNKRRTN